MEKILYDKKTAAAALSISVRMLDNLIFRRELPVRRVGRRVLLERRVLEAFARRDHVTPDGGDR